MLGAFDGKELLGFDAGFFFDFHLYHQWFIQGSKTQLPYTKMVLKIFPCSLEDRDDCMDVDQLSQTQLVLMTLQNSMDFQNYSNPIRDGFDPDLTPVISLNTQAKFTIWIQSNHIYDNRDSDKRDRPKFSFYNIEKIDSTTGTRDMSTHCTGIAIEDGSCMPYVTIELKASQWETIIERRYYRMYKLISDVGGLYDIIMYAFLTIYAIFRSTRYKNWVILQYFGDWAAPEQIGVIAPKFYQSNRLAEVEKAINTRSLIKKKANRDLIFSRLLKEMEVMDFLIFSQKSFILTQIAPQRPCYETLRPFVLFNRFKKKKISQPKNVLLLQKKSSIKPTGR